MVMMDLLNMYEDKTKIANFSMPLTLSALIQKLKNAKLGHLWTHFSLLILPPTVCYPCLYICCIFSQLP